ncbi:response regulator receiver domain [Pectobacterium sp. PL64]|uniref:response regulator receiver domain n=1 Tax=Pectobacterium sp. PL64 TaxID=2738983 RepID=UPI001F0B948B|nr:response regulator receiver domain [Pectobacterium sp. PL64]UMO89139.1 response regulator receiver domain [Pectobacterium sp. PL64]
MTDTAITYSSLIEEAFIKTIRNVTVIDDEYPTLLSLIEQQFSKADNQPAGGNTATATATATNANVDIDVNIARLKKIISMCHSQYQWGVDVFNGQSPNIGGDSKVPPHIHHSDLIILDYHLDGDTEDDGTRAREIIKSLDQNNHYNSILVHTKGYAGDIKNVFVEILSNLVVIDADNPFIPSEDTNTRMNDWLDENNDGMAYPWVGGSIDFLSILRAYTSHNSEALTDIHNEQHVMYGFLSQINEISTEAGIEVNELLKWKFYDLLKDAVKFEKQVGSDLVWEWDDESNFISTGKTFISVIRKSSDDPAEELVGSLHAALVKRNASPMHLLMAKMRYELDERGIEQACNIINNRPAQAGWLFNLLEQADNDSAHDKAINLHWEQLATASRLELRDFSKRLIKAASCTTSLENRDFVKGFFSECMADKDKTLGLLNAYSCSMSVNNNHLRTGTILKIGDDKWVCVTPACDMVPGQRVNQWQSRIGDTYLAFKAVKLEAVAIKEANKNANRNDYLFLNENNTPLAYSLGKDNIVWDTFFATEQGYYKEGQSIILYAAREEEKENIKTLVMKDVNAVAIAELRYEYALNILHKFGASQTRVGLDFQDIRSMWG